MISPAESKCGDCHACCEVLGFTGEWKEYDTHNEADKYDINFGAWQTCNKLCDTGCSIWNNKPKICDDFFCSYITENLTDDYRPNQSQILPRIRDGILILHSLDKTLPPEIQHDKKKQLLDNLAEEIFVSIGKKIPVLLTTKQGELWIRR